MSIRKQYSLSHSNQYGADSACTHCEGIIRHESWCITQNAGVHYAHQAALFPNQLSLEDRIILHGWGVAWRAENVQSKGRAIEGGTLETRSNVKPGRQAKFA